MLCSGCEGFQLGGNSLQRTLRPKLLALDVDGVLSDSGCPIEPETAALLRDIEGAGARIALASGKSASYLAGLARGIGIRAPLIAGENGCVVLDPGTATETLLAQRPFALDRIEGRLRLEFGDSVWIQPNQVQLTVLPRDGSFLGSVLTLIKEAVRTLDANLLVYAHEDTVDVLPPGVDKGRALAAIRARCGVAREDVVAVGDGGNDLPLFAEAGLGIVVGDKLGPVPQTERFLSGGEALRFVRGLF